MGIHTQNVEHREVLSITYMMHAKLYEILPSVICLLPLILPVYSGNQFFEPEPKKFFSEEARLADYLLNGYDKSVRPTGKNTTATIVKMDLTLQQIISLKEKTEELITSLYMGYYWYDSRLTWDPSEYDEIEKICLSSDLVWTPDIILTNSRDDQMEQALVVNAIIYSTGKVEWLPMSLYSSSCSVQVGNFPFDTQNCSLVFRSSVYDGNELKLIANSPGILIDPSVFVPNGEWKLIDSPAYVLNPEGDDMPYQISFIMVIKRMPQFYILNIVLPCVLQTLLTCLTYYLPTFAGEKISLSITLLLGDTVFVLLIVQRLPSTSDSVPLLAAYLFFSILLLIVCVALSIITQNIHFRTLKTHRMSPWLREFGLDFLRSILGLKKPQPIHLTDRGRDDDSRYKTTVKELNLSASDEKLAVSELLYKKEATKFGMEHSHKYMEEERKISIPLFDSLKPVTSPFKSTLNHLRIICAYLKRSHREKLESDDWNQLAMIIDRFFLWVNCGLFVFVSLGFYIVVLSLYYSKHIIFLG